MQKKILVVDDDESILDAVSLLLSDYGYEVLSIFKGEEIYEKIKEFHPDLILLDVLMSGKDGREICKNLKSIADTRRIPIMMMSAHPNAKQGANECGADGFISKPFEIESLLSLISRYL